MHSVDEHLSMSHFQLAIPFSLLLGGVAVLVDIVIPWRSEVMVCLMWFVSFSTVQIFIML